MIYSIVSGHKGLIGKALIRELKNQKSIVIQLENIPKQANSSLVPFREDENIYTIKFNWEEVSAENLSNVIKEFINDELSLSNINFYNLAWKGDTSLTKGEIDIQMKNIYLGVYFLKTAAFIGCDKFVNVGSMEEIIYERILSSKSFKEPWDQSCKWYAHSKYTLKDLLSYLAYRKKIKFIHTRVSVVIDKKLSTPKFIELNLKNIKANKKWVVPTNNEIVNISSNEEIARQLRVVSFNSDNNLTINLGTGTAHTLEEYFNYFDNILNRKLIYKMEHKIEGIYLKQNDFKNKAFFEEVGYDPLENIHSLFKEISL